MGSRYCVIFTIVVHIIMMVHASTTKDNVVPVDVSINSLEEETKNYSYLSRTTGEVFVTVDEDTCRWKYPKCLETQGSCIKNDRRSTVCQCPKYSKYQWRIGCKYDNGSCIGWFSKCIATGGYCMPDNDGRAKCNCPEATTYVEVRGCTDYKCIKTCGTEPDVRCQEDTHGGLKCLCSSSHTQFDYDTKKCRYDRCFFVCGVFHDEIKEVYCEGGPFGDVKCACSDDKKIFDDKDKKCKNMRETCRDKFPNCLDTNGTCKTIHKERIECFCRDSGVYQKGVGCRSVKNTCKELFPNCVTTQGSCKFNRERDGSVRLTSFQCQCPKFHKYVEEIGGCKDEGIHANILIWILCSVIVLLLLIIGCLITFRYNKGCRRTSKVV